MRQLGHILTHALALFERRDRSSLINDTCSSVWYESYVYIAAACMLAYAKPSMQLYAWQLVRDDRELMLGRLIRHEESIIAIGKQGEGERRPNMI